MLTEQEENTLISEFNFVSQLSHLGWGIAIMLIVNLIGDSIVLDLCAFAVWLIYTGLKEFYYDEKYEIPIIRGSSVMDFCVQVGGAIIGLLLIIIF